MLLPVALLVQLHVQIVLSDALLNQGDSVAKCPTFESRAVSSNLWKNGRNPQHNIDGWGTSGSTTFSRDSNRGVI